MNTVALIDESFSVRLVQTLFHLLWQGTLIGLVAYGVERLIACRTAQAKYLLHVCALVAMVACLPVTFALVEVPAEIGEEIVVARAFARPDASQKLVFDQLAEKGQIVLEETVEESTVPRESESASQSGADEIAVTSMAAPRTQGPIAVSDWQRSLAARGVPRDSRWVLAIVAPYLTLAYLLCVAALFARLAWGVWGAHKLRATAIAVADADLLRAIARQARRLGLRAAPAVAYCRRISVPIVVGIVRPMILLPASLACGLPLNQLEALIAHELAHLRRWDPVVNILQRLAETIVFFHPAVWYVSRRIRVERENASDDLVLAAGWERIHYADALVRMAELATLVRTGQRSMPAAALAASGGNQSDFKRRVMRLLDAEPTQFRLSPTGLLLLLAIVASTVMAPLAVRTWAQQAATDTDDRRLGRQIDDFRLSDGLGKEYSLSDFADCEILVVAFLGVECPVSKLYGARLESLAAKYKSRGVAVIGIDSNQQDTPTELARYARASQITFPLLKDPGNRVADQFRAERTPEAFVLDHERKVRYWGRIDDQFGVGYARQSVMKDYVADAIDDLLSEWPVREDHVASTGCHIGRVRRTAPTGDIIYANQISRLVGRRCIECHRDGGIAPFALDSYETVAAWAETILEVVHDERMPPWHANPKYGHFSNDARMPDAEKTLLAQWVANGVPKGDDGDLPPKREFIDGWAMGQPDLLLTIPEPITVPATGMVEYQYISVDPGFTEGKWVRASEIRPGVRSVVHHIVVFISSPGGDPVLKERGVGFETVGIYVPGAPPMNLEEGVARYVPPGSKLVFQLHYTPDGSERHDQSQIGLYFADPTTVRRTMQTGAAANLDFEIPPEAADFRVEATHRFSHDMQVYSMAPHMHFRGKAFRIEAIYPNGSREILLDVPRYDFNWQHSYKLWEPKFMPEGTLLRCVGRFDNSADNLANPDPSAAVRWGEQTWEEMMIGYFEGVFLNQDLSLSPPEITDVGGGKYRIRFSYRPDRPARTVHVAGTFNEWSTSSQPMTDPDGDGIYTAEVTLPAGDYRYKFVLDGNYWTHDPASRILTGFVHESFFVAGADDKVVQRSEK